MRLSIAATLILVFCFLGFSGRAYGAAEDAVYLKNIASQPNSEAARFDFAFFLYKGKRFAESRAQLMVLFGLNSSHAQGRKLLRHMNEIEGLSDTAYMDRQMQAYVAEKEREDLSRTAVNPTASVVSTADLDIIMKDLERNYALSTALKNEYKPLKDEEAYRLETKSLTESSAFDRAERKHKEWIQKFPDSPLAQVEFLKFLVNRDRIEQAGIIFESRKVQFGHFPRYRFVGNCIQETKNAKSIEQKVVSKAKMQRYMTVYEQALEKSNAVVAVAPPVPASPAPSVQQAGATQVPQVTAPPPVAPSLPPPPSGVVSGALPSRNPTTDSAPAAKTNP